MNWTFELIYFLIFIAIYLVIFLKYYRSLRVSYDFTRKIFFKFFLRILIFFLFFQLIFNFKDQKQSDSKVLNELFIIELSEKELNKPSIETELIEQINSHPEYNQLKISLNYDNKYLSISPILFKEKMIQFLGKNILKELPLLETQHPQYAKINRIKLEGNLSKSKDNLNKQGIGINLNDLNNASFKYYLLILLFLFVFTDYQLNFRIIKD